MEDWERAKVAQRRVEEVKEMVDMERGLAMTPPRKRREDKEEEESGTGGKEKRQRKLLHPVLEDNWGEGRSKDDLKEAKEQRN